MTQQMRDKLNACTCQSQRLSQRLLETDARRQPALYRRLQREFSHADELSRLYLRWQSLDQALRETQSYLSSDSEDMRQLSAEELRSIEKKIDALEQDIQQKMIPVDPSEGKNLYLEIRAGSGGIEAAIFCADLYRMYKRYAETKQWAMDIVSCSATEQGGYREIVCLVKGQQAWSCLRFESGVHRVQRVPVTESQGRIHTSAASVAVMPEVEAIEDLPIQNNELRIDTFRASGAGGQHVNKTDSAIRITHLPTSLVVECQSERSQHKNKAQALALLRAKLLERNKNEQRKSQGELRRSIIGSGDRSERIRTYNYPQGRISDHRINLTLYNLEQALDGQIDPLIEALRKQWQIEQLSNQLAETA